jgi:hypothetical protein
MARCNPYGYATDAGPKHLMGGMYGPQYAGRQTTERNGIRGPAICTRTADRRMRLVCPYGHAGPVMDLCGLHALEIMDRMAQCCTRCVWPDAARGVNEAIDWLLAERGEAIAAGDKVRAAKLTDAIDDHARQMDELMARGIIRKVPLKLVEVS